MYSKCPGQDSRNLRVSLHKCPNCGAEVEIFSDEIKVKCQKKMFRKPITQALVSIVLAILVFVLLLTGCTSTPTSTTSTLEDLAYIKAYVQNYTDDADPEPEGIEIFVLYFDKESKPLSFTGVAVQIDVELDAYPIEPGQKLPTDNAEEALVYKGRFARDHTEETIGGTMMVIRIPFEDIDINPSEWWQPAFGKVTVETPKQGVFSAQMSGSGYLYP
jgi:hypothetical protein